MSPKSPARVPSPRVLWLVVLAAGCGPGASSAPSDGAPGDAGPGIDLAARLFRDLSVPPPTDDAAAPRDAGPDGGGGRNYSSDRNLFLGPSRCALAKLMLCEDFESGALDAKTWTVLGNKPTIDGVHAARGAKALHISLAGNGGSMLQETKTFPATKNTYWGRIFVYFNALPTAPGMAFAHWTYVYATGTGVSGQIRMSGTLQNGVNRFGVGTDNRVDPMGTGDWNNSDNDPAGKPNPVPLKQWTCIEWLHKGETNETRFFWDAVEHPSMYTTSTKHGGNANPYILPQFNALAIGFAEYQASTEPFEMWVDEIAIDAERIGCVM